MGKATAAEDARYPALMHVNRPKSFTIVRTLHEMLTVDARAMESVSAKAVSSQAALLENKPLPAQRKVTIRNPPFTYLHLTLLTSTFSVPIANSPPIDILTARAHLTSALSQFLGITGTAIPIDFLRVEGRNVWIRIPREDAVAVVGALSQWVGRDGGTSWKVNGKGEWLGVVAAADGHQLFQP